MTEQKQKTFGHFASFPFTQCICLYRENDENKGFYRKLARKCALLFNLTSQCGKKLFDCNFESIFLFKKS